MINCLFVCLFQSTSSSSLAAAPTGNSQALQGATKEINQTSQSSAASVQDCDGNMTEEDCDENVVEDDNENNQEIQNASVNSTC